jgi:hypothetical protein
MPPHKHITANKENFQPLVDKALASSDPRQIEFLIRSISLSPVDETRKEQAFYEILRANKSVNNVVAMCLINLRAFGDDAVRKGVHCVLQQPDSVDTEVVKMCAIVRLIGLEQHSSEEAQLIAHFAFHPSSSVRWQTRREVGGLPESHRRELIAANKPNVDAADLNAKYFELLLRALPLTEAAAS